MKRVSRVFTKLRQILSGNATHHLDIAFLKQDIVKLGNKQDNQDKNIELLFEYIDRLQEAAYKLSRTRANGF